MNKRQKEWQREVNESINNYEMKNNSIYNYYAKIKERKHIKSTRGLWYWIRNLIRITLGISLLIYSILRYFNKI